MPAPGTELLEGDLFHVPLVVHEREMDAFAQISGDYNALHCDESYAATSGFKGRVVYGGLIIAAISKLVGMKLPGPGWIWQSLSIQFKKPLYLGKAAEISAKVSYCNSALGVYRLKFDVNCDRELIAQGDAQVGQLIPKETMNG
jgi:acyl dehydratase